MTPSRSKLISTALRRGLRKRCPHCGEGQLFSGWSQLEHCSICGLVFVRNPGDTWAFTIIGDRLPIAAIIILIYFGVVHSHRALGLTLMAVLVALLVWTAPNRWGAGIALHYLSRVQLARFRGSYPTAGLKDLLQEMSMTKRWPSEVTVSG